MAPVRALRANRPDRVEAIVEAGLPGATMVGRRPSPYATSHGLEEIKVTWPGHGTRRLLAKHVGWRAMTPAAQRAKPEDLRCAGRELAVYRHVLAGADLDTPTLIGGWSSGRDGVLVVEQVEGVRLTDVGDFTAWEAAARWLARMHAKFGGRQPMLPELVSYDRDLLHAQGKRGITSATQQDLGSADVLQRLADSHARAVNSLASVAPTIVHGDFYPSNIVVAADRMAVVDWELAGFGPGVLDLAALVAGDWSRQERVALVSAYHHERAKTGLAEVPAALMRRVEEASLHLALTWVGSAPSWEAPAEHRRDWFADAVQALDHIETRAV